MNTINEINVLEVKDRLDNDESLVIIDVREVDELKICEINNTLHIPMMEIPNQLDQLNKDDELIILCRSGQRSARVCHFLSIQGFKNTKNLQGGILEWIRLVDPSMQTY